MDCVLRVNALGRFPVVTISDENFRELKAARATLSAALGLEEAYDIVIENQLELEKEVLGISAENMLRIDFGYERIQQSRSSIARRLANLLTTTKVYIDQAPRLSKKILGESRAVSALLSTEYDANLSYRFMSAYRNHVQHYSVALHSVTFGGERDPVTSHLSNSTTPWATKQELGRDKQMKVALLSEPPDRINILEMSRGYIASLSRVHRQIRVITVAQLDHARKAFISAQSRYLEEGSESVVGLCAQLLAEGAVQDEIPILLDWDDARLWLVKRTGFLGDLDRQYVTSEIPKA